MHCVSEAMEENPRSSSIDLLFGSCDGSSAAARCRSMEACSFFGKPRGSEL